MPVPKETFLHLKSNRSMRSSERRARVHVSMQGFRRNAAATIKAALHANCIQSQLFSRIRIRGDQDRPFLRHGYNVTI